MKKHFVSLQLTSIRFQWITKESKRLGITKREVLNRLIDATAKFNQVGGKND